MSYQTTCIFSAPPDLRQPPVPVVGSFLIHGLALGFIAYGIMYNPAVIVSPYHDRYSVRHLDLSTPAARLNPLPADDRKHSSWLPNAIARTTADRMGELLQLQRPVRSEIHLPQTLIQPDLPRHFIDPVDFPVPAFVIWNSHTVAATRIVPPVETSYPLTATPSISPPNAASTPANIAMAATDLQTRNGPAPVATTSPVALHQAVETSKALVTVSQTVDEPTPVALMSISDFHTFQGRAIVPPVNETGASNTHDREEQLIGHALTSIPPRNEHQGREGNDTTVNDKSTDKASKHAPGSFERSEQESIASLQANLFSPHGNHPSAALISLPKDGKFGAVVVGESLDDRYPELDGFWRGRLIYTVYLHVGLTRSWILQYSFSASAEAPTLDAVAHVDAPWPYSIVRPDLLPGSIDANALMVSGIINQDGRFESLRLVFPPRFPDADYVLNCLQQWQFRPAAHNGHPTRLEVMLIIPNDDE